MWGGVLLLLGAVGCVPTAYSSTSTRPTPAQIGTAESTVNAARTAGAQNDSTAGQYLALAERELSDGKRHLQHGYDQSATWLLARATADAELSRALIMRAHQEGLAKSSEQQVVEARQQLREEQNKSSTPETTPSAPSD